MAARLEPPVTRAEAEAARAMSQRASDTDKQYRIALMFFRAARELYDRVSKQDLKAAAGARGRAMASGMCDADTWREAFTADLDRLARGVAGTDAR
ncbi:hypothetical protein [Parafrankia sp. FMc2]|uniref:hypothetical protein n=1 Tax=Parafrankia sp. FMc2 TaxID=3233196 RepID=UPI0034D42459